MKKKVFVLSALILMAGLCICLSGTVATEKRWDIVSTHELKRMLDAGEDLSLVCTLPRIIFDVRHIKGSLSIPIGKITTSPDMPDDKGKRIIFYCLGAA
jgi:hypothetical protein